MDGSIEPYQTQLRELRYSSGVIQCLFQLKLKYISVCIHPVNYFITDVIMMKLPNGYHTLIKTAVHIVVLMYQLEFEKKSCTLSSPLYFTELDDLYVPHIFYIQNA